MTPPYIIIIVRTCMYIFTKSYKVQLCTCIYIVPLHVHVYTHVKSPLYIQHTCIYTMDTMHNTCTCTYMLLCTCTCTLYMHSKTIIYTGIHKLMMLFSHFLTGNYLQILYFQNQSSEQLKTITCNFVSSFVPQQHNYRWRKQGGSWEHVPPLEFL